MKRQAFLTKANTQAHGMKQANAFNVVNDDASDGESLGHQGDIMERKKKHENGIMIFRTQCEVQELRVEQVWNSSWKVLPLQRGSGIDLS